MIEDITELDWRVEARLVSGKTVSIYLTMDPEDRSIQAYSVFLGEKSDPPSVEEYKTLSSLVEILQVFAKIFANFKENFQFLTPKNLEMEAEN